jgi:hypothetical protein
VLRLQLRKLAQRLRIPSWSRSACSSPSV